MASLWNFETDIGTYSGSIDNFINFCFITVILSLVIEEFKFDDVKKLFFSTFSCWIISISYIFAQFVRT